MERYPMKHNGFWMILLWPFIVLADEPHSGWLWYHDPVVEEDDAQPEKQNTPALSSPSQPLSAVDRLEQVKAQFEEAKALAILEPTLENVAITRQHHNAILNQANAFSEQWSIAELLDQRTPYLQTSPGALKIQADTEQKELSQDLKELSKSFGLIFAYKKSCPYCHQFASLILSFASEFGFDLEGLTPDEGVIEGIPTTRDMRALQNINPTLEFPVLYLANPKEGLLIPIARGYLSRSELIANVKHALNYLKGRH